MTDNYHGKLLNVFRVITLLPGDQVGWERCGPGWGKCGIVLTRYRPGQERIIPKVWEVDRVEDAWNGVEILLTRLAHLEGCTAFESAKYAEQLLEMARERARNDGKAGQ